MTVRALACDYDGTLAWDDRIGPEALAALERARAAGLRLLLVTGRTFFELTRVCAHLDLFDAVVAENGGVLYFPQSGAMRDLAPPPPPRLLGELDRRGIYYQVGRVVIGASRTAEPGIRDALAAVGVERALVHNRASLMLLPPGVSKGTGVRLVIRDLGLSFHDVLAFGDAENDVALFDACGVTACPDSAVPALKPLADWIVPGANGGAIARAIGGPVLDGGLVVESSSRHRIPIGWAVGTSETVEIPARGVNVLIHGEPLSGKSWLAGALVERLIARAYAVCVLDPEGDYHVLSGLPGVTWAEVPTDAALARLLTHLEHDPAASVVVDLSTLSHAGKLRMIERALRRVRDLRRRLGRPHWVVLDEAHYSLHRHGIPEQALGLKEKGVCLVTYRPSWLEPSVVKAVDICLLARTTAAEELAFLQSALDYDAARRALSVLPELPRGEFVMIDRRKAGPSGVLTFVPTPRETAHVRHLTKYAESVVPPERRFVFRDRAGRVTAVADSLNGFRHLVRDLDGDALAGHATRGDFSRWVLGVFSDRDLGVQLRKIEARWQRGELQDLREAIERAVAIRYGPDRVGA